MLYVMRYTFCVVRVVRFTLYVMLLFSADQDAKHCSIGRRVNTGPAGFLGVEASVRRATTSGWQLSWASKHFTQLYYAARSHSLYVWCMVLQASYVDLAFKSVTFWRRLGWQGTPSRSSLLLRQPMNTALTSHDTVTATASKQSM